MQSQVKASHAALRRRERGRYLLAKRSKELLESAEALDLRARASVAGAIFILQEPVLDHLALAINWLRSAQATHEEATRMRKKAFNDGNEAGDFITAGRAKEGLFRKK